MAKYFSLVVLDGGPGGYVTAIRTFQLGLKTAVVEKQYWDGVCLSVGCIPFKSLLKNAEVVHIFSREAKTFGISGDISLDFGAAHARSCKVFADIAKDIHFLTKENRITEINGFGEFAGPTSMTITGGDDKDKETTFDKAIIATGSVVRSLPDVEVGGSIVSYEEQILSDKLPGSMVIVGVGAIGMEFAYMLANYGVDTAIVEFMDGVLPNEDADVFKTIAKEYKKLGVKLTTGHKITSIVDNGGSIEAKIKAKGGGGEQTLTTDHVMVSIGFAPRAEGIGLDKAGVKLGERGEIIIDEYMCTNVDNIYAIGDVTTKLQLVHVAEAQDVIAAEHMAGHETGTALDCLMMPRATFCNPQVASFGKTEARAKKWVEKNGRKIRISTFPFSANGEAQGLAGPAGSVRLVADAECGELLGGHMVGASVSELVPQLALAEKCELTTEEIDRVVHIHPTMSEAMKEAAEGIMGKMINL